MIGHLRPVKDPFRTALAARTLHPDSRIQVVQIGAALDEYMKKAARVEEEFNSRYRWIGELPRWKTIRTLARCHLMALTSHMEGGANVIGEAIACSVPVVSSRISGSIGLLGGDYPAYFPVGDTQALAKLLTRVEADTAFYDSIKEWCERLQPLVDPARERQSWEDLLGEFQS